MKSKGVLLYILKTRLCNYFSWNARDTYHLRIRPPDDNIGTWLRIIFLCHLQKRRATPRHVPSREILPIILRETGHRFNFPCVGLLFSAGELGRIMTNDRGNGSTIFLRREITTELFNKRRVIVIAPGNDVVRRFFAITKRAKQRRNLAGCHIYRRVSNVDRSR